MNSNKDYTDYIKEHIALPEVCERLGVHTKRRGNIRIALCPFHNDKKPSLNIYKDHYHCYACEAHGNLFGLIGKVRDVDFQGALSWVEKEFPEILRQKPIRYKDHRPGRRPMELAGIYYAAHEGGLIEEAAKTRGYPADFLHSAGICETNGTVLCQKAAAEELGGLIQADLILSSYKGGAGGPAYQDYFFTPQLLFTIQDSAHRIVGFAGRAVSGGSGPKYLYTRGLPKESVLYRLNAVISRRSAPEGNGELCSLCLVEGFFDALRLEYLGLDAVAVMGSRLSDRQLHLLEQFVEQQAQLERTVELKCFLDSDKAGVEGIYQMLKSLWRSDVLRHTPVAVIVNREYLLDPDQSGKDPDEMLKGMETTQQTADWLCTHQIHPLEFLLRYFLNRQVLFQADSSCSLAKQWEELAFPHRARITNQLSNLFSRSIWTDLLDFYHNSGETPDSRYVLRELERAMRGGPIRSASAPNVTRKGARKVDVSPYALALETARSGYRSEAMPMDAASWDRLQAGINLVERYNTNLLSLRSESRHLLRFGAPLLAFYTPKDEETDRLKALPDHETLLLQHYVLHELLQEDVHTGYAQMIPAVRYDPEVGGTYTTGLDDAAVFEAAPCKAVSFAYQADMPVLRGDRPPTDGIFRHYYDCWKDFIAFLQEGIRQIEGEYIYRAKLDIRGYYDNIQKRMVRDALIHPLTEAFGYMENKFIELKLEEDKAKRAEAVLDLILEGLFGWSYIDPQSGNTVQVADPLTGIPQGPALSAYAANILLFPLDRAVSAYINEANAQCEPGHIRARYARYVDDMVILTSDRTALEEIERIINEQLYKIGLELSAKTEHPDLVDKEEARWWLVDQRGGLGVSAAQLVPEDLLDELWGMGGEPHAVNRRDALNILKSAGDILDSAGQEQFEEAFISCFRTEEIRYRDSVRLAAFLLEHLLTAETPAVCGELYGAFSDYWRRGQAKMRELRSILSRSDIGPMVFLDGLALLLERKIPLNASPEERMRQQSILYSTAKYVEGWTDIDQAVSAYGATAPQGNNASFLRLRAIQLCALAADIPTLNSTERLSLFQRSWSLAAPTDAGEGLKHYLQRWQYMLAETDSAPEMNARPLLFDDFPAPEMGEFQLFHFLTACLSRCSELKWFAELGNLFLNHMRTRLDADLSEMFRIERIWFSTETLEEDGGLAGIALQSLSNFLQRSCLPGAIYRSPTMRRALFQQNGGDERSLSYLPVPPVSRYSGIFAIDTAGTAVYRADFSFHREEADKFGVPELNWEAISTPEDAKWAIYRAMLPDAPWKPLASPLETAPEKWPHAVVGEIVGLYEDICRLFEAPKAGYILSKHHLFRGGTGKLYALSYYARGLAAPSGVALSGQSPYLKWTLLEGDSGKAQRAAALLLDDLLWLKQYPIHTENTAIVEVLLYALNRLTGRKMKKFLGGLSERSFQETVRRTLATLRNFARTGPEEAGNILLETAVEDCLMTARLGWSHGDFSLGEEASFLIAWAGGTVVRTFSRLEQAVLGLPGVPEPAIPLRRVTAAWRAIGIRLLSLKSEGCESIRNLGRAALVSAVCHDIRTRVLECVWALKYQEAEQLKKRPLPVCRIEAPNPDADVVLLLRSEKSPEEQAEELRRLMIQYRGGRGESRLDDITPIGWHLLLAWVVGLDVPSAQVKEGITGDGGRRLEILEAWEGLKEFLLILNDPEKMFPYDGLDSLLSRWTEGRTDELLGKLHLIDRLLGFEIRKKESPFLILGSRDLRRGQITLQLDTVADPVYPRQFVSFLGDSDRNIQYEQTDNRRIWTQTMLGERILSISAVAQKIAAFMTERGPVYTESPPQTQADKTVPASAEPASPVIAEGRLPSEPEAALTVQSTDGSVPAGPGGPGNTSVPAPDGKPFREKLHDLQVEQQKNWKQRGNINSNIDRIALFQFDVDDSYTHPLSECCTMHNTAVEDMLEVKRDPSLWDAEKAAQHQQTLYSCAEYRRRRLLEAAFSACQTFGVDILLLPEYSVRPETAQWILDEMRRKPYEFSVWAGTCRLAPGRDYQNVPFAKLQDAMYDDSAVLPIICNKPKLETDLSAEKYPELLLRRFKKYPAISMEELIHPQDQTLVPVIKDLGCLFGDARDDVLELICAEVFLATNPGNILAFAQIYDRLRARFADGSTDIGRQRDQITDDLIAIGQHISTVQLKKSYVASDKSCKRGIGKYGRTPILLVPAYTTRAVDYYITGQAGYLATGLTMAFCNAAGGRAIGGSCFTGTDCWEKDGAEREIFMPDYSLYHGAQPGIYHQYDTRKWHGALGKREQALLICDINPAASIVGRPRPESLLHPLTLVAHLPVIESCVYGPRTKTDTGLPCGFYERCRCDLARKRETNGGKDPVIRALSELSDILNRFNSRGGTSAYDSEPDKLYHALFRLGGELGSYGLQERAEFYARFHRHNPQTLPPATMLDWLWVDVDFPESIATDDWDLDVPAFAEKNFPSIGKNP